MENTPVARTEMFAEQAVRKEPRSETEKERPENGPCQESGRQGRHYTEYETKVKNDPSLPRKKARQLSEEVGESPGRAFATGREPLTGTSLPQHTGRKTRGSS